LANDRAAYLIWQLLLAALNDEFVALVRGDEHKRKESGRGHVVDDVLVPRKPPE
jgi:hypothetical protein